MFSSKSGRRERDERHGDLSRTGFVILAVCASLVSFAGAAGAGGLITGRDVKDGTLLSRDLRDGRGVMGADVRDGSLSAADLGSLPQGEQGPPGPDGLDGLDGLDQISYETTTEQIAPGASKVLLIDCPGAKVAVGGGADSAVLLTEIEETAPVADGTGWQTRVHNAHTAPIGVVGYAVCVEVP